MKLHVLGSSSQGNCYVLSTPTGDLMLECGIRFRDIQKALYFDFDQIIGCLVTHEHKDHCKAAGQLVERGIDVYMSYGTASVLNMPYTIWAKHANQFAIGDFVILPFDTEHDAVEPLGFLIQYRPTGEKILFATDTYYLRHKFNGLNYILVECNYIKETLDANIEAGHIPVGMKNRLLESHFSLEHVKEFLQANDMTTVRKIVLLHLSDSNSDEERMVKEVSELTGRDTVAADKGMVIDLELCLF